MFRWCVSLSGVSVLLQSISLYIWLVRQPIRCIRFILIYRPIGSLGMGPYVPIAISVAIGRDWLVRCYRAFVHVGAYSVISRLWLNHVDAWQVDMNFETTGQMDLWHIRIEASTIYFRLWVLKSRCIEYLRSQYHATNVSPISNVGPQTWFCYGYWIFVNIFFYLLFSVFTSRKTQWDTYQYSYLEFIDFPWYYLLSITPFCKQSYLLQLKPLVFMGPPQSRIL